MEEKKFPWLLRLLSQNPCGIPILETFAIHQEKVMASFINDFNNNIIQTHSKNLPFNTVSKCLDYISSQQSFQAPDSIKHLFFKHKGQSTEISQFLLSSLRSKKKPLPSISYIQAAREPFAQFITCVSEHSKNTLKSTIFPSQSNNSVCDRAKKISSEISFVIEQFEHKKVRKIKIEFFVDKSFQLFVSYMNYCCLGSSRRKKEGNSLRVGIGKKVDLKVRSHFSQERVLSGIGFNGRLDKLETARIGDEEMDKESSDSLKESSGSDSEENEEKLDYQDNFMELICNTRIARRSVHRKFWISDEEMEKEKHNVCGIIEEAMKNRNREKNLWLKNSSKYRKYNSKASLGGLLMSIDTIKGVEHKKTFSQFNASLPFLHQHKRNTMF